MKARDVMISPVIILGVVAVNDHLKRESAFLVRPGR